jgi:hypothetical protein
MRLLLLLFAASIACYEAHKGQAPTSQIAESPCMIAIKQLLDPSFSDSLAVADDASSAFHMGAFKGELRNMYMFSRFGLCLATLAAIDTQWRLYSRYMIAEMRTCCKSSFMLCSEEKPRRTRRSMKCSNTYQHITIVLLSNCINTSVLSTTTGYPGPLGDYGECDKVHLFAPGQTADTHLCLAGSVALNSTIGLPPIVSGPCCLYE